MNERSLSLAGTAPPILEPQSPLIPSTRARAEACAAYWRRNASHFRSDVPSASVTNPRYPDFFIIGAQKAATTWLASQLVCHPQIAMPIVKELVYFEQIHLYPELDWAFQKRLSQLTGMLNANVEAVWSREQVADAIRLYGRPDSVVDDRWYAENFRLCGVDQLCGEATPSYAVLPYAAIAHMRRLSPHAKLIYILRDPFGRAWSHLRMLMGEHGALSAEAQLAELKRSSIELRAHSDYASVFRRFANAFGRERLCVVPYSQIGRAPNLALKTIVEFLGLDFDERFFLYADIKVFEGQRIALEDEVRFALNEVIAEAADDAARAFPELAGEW